MSMDLPPEIMKELLETFALELDEQLQAITNGLLNIEKGLDEQGKQLELDNIFRAAHSIKGASRGVGVEAVGEISHQMESLFSRFKKHSEIPQPEVYDLCLESLDRIRDAFTAFNDATEPGFDVSEISDRLKAAAAGDTITNKPPKRKVVSKKVEASGTAKTKKKMPKADETVMPVTEKDDPVDEAAENKADPLNSGVVRVRVEKLDDISALTEELQTVRLEVNEHLAVLTSMQQRIENLMEIWRPVQGRASVTQSSMPQVVRTVLAENLDTLTELNNIGESLLLQMRDGLNNLGQVSTGLQDNMHALRMVPASTLLQPLTRSVRDIARELGKKINLELKNIDVEMDRSILTELNAPLVHLLRNAIDHGIENVDERMVCGKPEAGNITIRIESEGGHIIIYIEDDGAGIDIDKVFQTALRRKLVKEADRKVMDESAMLDLIFHPGFSTKSIITEVSGRGVGLDVVRTVLEKVKGKVSLHTNKGKGTIFALHLPKILATERGLLLRVDSKVFALPTTSIGAVMHLKQDDIVDVEAGEAVLVQNQPVPLYSLADMLNLQAHEKSNEDNISLIVIGTGLQKAGFQVDEVLDEREIVVKQLMPPLHAIPHINGATYSAASGVIIVLSGHSLVEAALRTKNRRRLNVKADKADATAPAHILVVDDSITTRTLERSVLKNHGYNVSVAVNGKEGWEKLQNEPFDLVVTDVEMPVMNGFELTQKIKQHDSYAGMPVMIVTSLASEADKKRGIDAGADAYIVKSQFESRALLEIIGQLI
jgi:two-component system chemotaxis sensor kinase CheA